MPKAELSSTTAAIETSVLPSNHFVDRSAVARRLNGRSVAIVGSGPGVLYNPPGFVDSHDVVVRCNNFRTINSATGWRCDVFYSFLGMSIRKTVTELKHAGVTLVMCKCPDAHAIESDWHVKHNKMAGVDFRWIYRVRKDWFFCDTYVPPVEDFLCHFHLLGGHIPTTGFAAILDVLSYAPKSIFLTGFDFFKSGIHNVTDPWRDRNSSDPIRHVPERELDWLRARMGTYPITCDDSLSKIIHT